MKALPKEKRNEILEMRRNITRALCGKVKVYASGQVVIEGVLDGSEAAQFELSDCSIAVLCYNAPRGYRLQVRDFTRHRKRNQVFCRLNQANRCL